MLRTVGWRLVTDISGPTGCIKMAGSVNLMLQQVMDMTYVKSWTFFTPGEEVSKYCLKVLLEVNSFARLMIFFNFVMYVDFFRMHFVFTSSQILTTNCGVLYLSVRQEAKLDSVTKKSGASLLHKRDDMTGGVCHEATVNLATCLVFYFIFLLKEQAPEVASYSVLNLLC
jgi:hypothetical protein